MPTHVVQQGECLSGIAQVYGLASWKVIYDASENASFREARPDPNIIHPGDRLHIPDPERREESGATEQNHKFKLTRPRTLFRVRVCGLDHEPLPNARYELTIGPTIHTGQTDGDGIVEQPIDAVSTRGQLKVFFDDEKFFEWPVSVGALDPVSYLTGVQARLKNLGIDPGPIDGINGPRTKRAVKAFQALHPPLAVDGIPGPRTQAKLKEVHGC